MAHSEQNETMTSIYDHLKINIEQTAKGARINVTLDRSDHDIEKAITQAVATYKETLNRLKETGLKIDES